MLHHKIRILAEYMWLPKLCVLHKVGLTIYVSKSS